MKTNKEPLRSAMDRRLSFLDELPSCRAALYHRIAQEEAPVMKKKLSVGLVFAIILVLITVAALAAGLLISPRVSASRTADIALKDQYGITEEMQTFFFREEEPLEDGSFRVTYTGVYGLDYVLGTYTALVKDGRAEISWSREGADVSGGYEADAWGVEQLKQMMTDAAKDDRLSYTQKAAEIAKKHNVTYDVPAETPETAPTDIPDDHELTLEDIDRLNQREAEKSSALEARKLSEDEMIAIGREFIISSYNLNEEQVSRLELYTNRGPTMELLALIGITEVPEQNPNEWYETIKGVPCFEVEYLLYSEGGDENRAEQDGYYIVYVNVETGAVEQFEYNSALGGWG
ncbi:MAG: hypothetical protein IKZ98_04640 [Clostridia bacterium]|nr:hypothetical protein [Clostridia bacterium]